jgi:hypothetical protein
VRIDDANLDAGLELIAIPVTYPVVELELVHGPTLVRR